MGQARVASVMHYGAVDIDPKHLVVWVLLDGAPDDRLPEWFSPDDRVQRERLDARLVSWTEELRAAVRSELARGGWPQADTADVMFDSAHRVEANGGFHYFK